MKDIDGIEGYGRNGFFWLKSFEVYEIMGGNEVFATTRVLFFSKIRKRRGRATGAPILFGGDKKEMIRLFSQVLKELKKL